VSNLITRRQVLIAGVKMASTLAPTSLLFGCGQRNAEQATTPTSLISPTTAASPTAFIIPTVAPTSTPTVSVVETRLQKELIVSSKAASTGGQWTAFEFNDLIDSMGEDSLKRMSKTLEIPPDKVELYTSTTLMKKEIKARVLDASKFFPGGNADEISYHEKVLLPTVKKLEIELPGIETYDTLSLERVVCDRVFEQSWITLNENERISFLEKSEWGIDQAQIIDLAAINAGILASLTTVVKLSGFSFYLGMSKGLYALGQAMNLTLPFAGYVGLSTAVSVATGPIGWIATAILAGTAIFKWLQQEKASDEKDLLITVLHLHHFKVSVMQEASIPFSIQTA